MKKEILKIAGVKSEKEFYKKYPTEEAFMKVHGKAFRKAQVGSYITSPQSAGFKPISFKDVYNPIDLAVTGMDDEMRMDQANPAAQQQIAANSGKKGGLSNILGSLGDISQIAESLEHGGYVHRAQGGFNMVNQFGPQLATYRRGMINSPTGQVTQQQTQALGFNNDGSNFGSKFQIGMENFGKSIGAGYDKLDSSLGKVGGVKGALGIGTDLIQGFQEIKEEKRIKNEAKQFEKLSGLVYDATASRPVEQERRNYVFPWDVKPDQLAEVKGTGAGFLQAQSGAEIQNTYAPNTLYDDLGYEPLDDSSVVKRYRRGGNVQRAQFGIDKAAGSLGNSLGSLIGGGKGAPTGGGRVGSAIGSTIGKFIPVPGASAILSGIGGLVGGIFGGKSAKQTAQMQERGEANMANAAFMSGVQGMQGNYGSFMEDGGYVSHDWQPQVIVKFGDYDVKQLLAPPKDADMLRSGGHLKEDYVQPSARALQTMAKGGKFTPLWGGDIEPVSYNPYMDGDGLTYEAKGNYHSQSDGKGNTGVGMDYAGSKVEVQPKEPIFETGGEIGASEQAATVLGGMKMPSYVLSELNDDTSKKLQAKKGQTFQVYGRRLNYLEGKALKTIDKQMKLLDGVDGYDPFSLLTLNSAKMGLTGADMSLQKIAEQKKKASYTQAGIHDAKDEMSERLGKPLEVNAFAKGIIKTDKEAMKQAKSGKKLESYQYSGKPLKANLPNPFAFKLSEPASLQYEPMGLPDSRMEDIVSPTAYDIAGVDRYFSNLPPSPLEDIVEEQKQDVAKQDSSSKKNKLDLIDIYNMVYPYGRPLIKNPLSNTQIAPEMLSLALNQLEPVPAQSFIPQLQTPYRISLQDQLNEIQADANSLKRLVGNNPEALAKINADVARAKSSILGQQLRLNTQTEMGVYRENIAALNDATLKNIGMRMDQAQKQSMARSQTKGQAVEAFKSIAEKIGQNKSETLAANVMANMFPQFTFGPQGRIFSTGLTKFNIPTLSDYSSEELQKILDAKKVEENKSKNTARNGSIVKAIKNL